MFDTDTTDGYTQALFGESAHRAGAWMYVQDSGDGMVSFVGASRVSGGGTHPFRYGSGRSHQFVLGELLLRPRLIIATDALRGSGLAGLVMSDHDTKHMLSEGEILLAQHH